MRGNPKPVGLKRFESATLGSPGQYTDFVGQFREVARSVKRRTVSPISRRFRQFRQSHGPLVDTPLSVGEVAFADAVKSCLRIVVDAGARIDIFYAELLRDTEAIVVMVEPNPRFADELRRRTSSFDPKRVVVLEVAVGRSAGQTAYFEEGQSLLPKSTMGRQHHGRLKKQIQVVTVDSIAAKYGSIDFLKTDLEEFDFFALLGARQSLASSIRFVQFELGIGAPFQDRRVVNDDYWTLLEDSFDLFLVEDQNNPFWSSVRRPVLVALDEDSKAAVESLQPTGVGFNVAAIRKDAWTPELRALTIRN